ncbi:Imm42 family immunity protein [Dyella silvatica]|uniref:Imm42 family immunity protein n=1 Tax=Dyella silvatica TaxID=2992128 RepID=UPI002258F389|nr:Imm42 family immunity protein [Dyella silvatica]
MLVGNKNKFAVHIDVKGIHDGWVFGTYIFWVNGASIGDENDDSVDLKGCWNWMRDFVESSMNRYEPGLYEMDKVQAYIYLAASVLPREMSFGFAEEIYSDTYERFHVSHIGMSSFDRVTLLMLTNEQGMERLVWREGDGDIQDAYLGAGQLESVFADAVRLLEDTMVSAGDKIR